MMTKSQRALWNRKSGRPNSMKNEIIHRCVTNNRDLDARRKTRVRPVKNADPSLFQSIGRVFPRTASGDPHARRPALAAADSCAEPSATVHVTAAARPASNTRKRRRSRERRCAARSSTPGTKTGCFACAPPDRRTSGHDARQFVARKCGTGEAELRHGLNATRRNPVTVSAITTTTQAPCDSI